MNYVYLLKYHHDQYHEKDMVLFDFNYLQVGIIVLALFSMGCFAPRLGPRAYSEKECFLAGAGEI